MTGFWDDPDLRAGGDYFKFENNGDSITGQILHMSKHVFDDGSVAPQLLVRRDDGTDVTVTCGQIRLKVELNEKRPKPGDRIRITQTDTEKRTGGKTLKHFEVLVQPGNLPPAQVAAQQEASALAQAFPAQAAQHQQPVAYTPPPAPQAPAQAGPFQQPAQAPAPDFAPPF